ncbi:hypothetical protein SFRURICE_003940 [Spodoptera frugiperda]|nr:hypothetical protein SFRURICE_003940 [Spodoptera frugiperda]
MDRTLAPLGPICGILMTFVVCQDETTMPATTRAEEEEEEEPKKGCSIWCWIQKIAMFVVSQLLSGN